MVIWWLFNHSAFKPKFPHLAETRTKILKLLPLSQTKLHIQQTSEQTLNYHKTSLTITNSEQESPRSKEENHKQIGKKN